MSVTLYDVSIPVMVRGFHSMAGFLERGRHYAKEAGIAEATLLDSRLFSDMMSLAQQVQRASDTAKRAAVRVADIPDLPMPDVETTFEELGERIRATIAFLERVSPETINARADAEILFPSGERQRRFTGCSFMLEFAIPNFFFHVATAYDLLRHNGVPLGKRHYLGWE